MDLRGKDVGVCNGETGRRLEGVGRGVLKDGTEVNILYMRTVNKT